MGWYSHELLYDGSYVLDSADLEWQGSRAWHGRESGLGAEFGLWFGMGLPGLGGSESDSRTDDGDPFDDPMEMDDLDEAEPSPSPPSASNTAKKLELNLGLGISPANYTTRVALEIPGDSAYAPQIDEALNIDLNFGARLFYYPSLLRRLRPLFGVVFA